MHVNWHQLPDASPHASMMALCFDADGHRIGRHFSPYMFPFIAAGKNIRQYVSITCCRAARREHTPYSWSPIYDSHRFPHLLQHSMAATPPKVFLRSFSPCRMQIPILNCESFRDDAYNICDATQHISPLFVNQLPIRFSRITDSLQCCAIRPFSVKMRPPCCDIFRWGDASFFTSRHKREILAFHIKYLWKQPRWRRRCHSLLGVLDTMSWYMIQIPHNWQQLQGLFSKMKWVMDDRYLYRRL